MPKQHPIRRLKQLNKHMAKARRRQGPSDFVLRLIAEEEARQERLRQLSS
jgi:hypothetical protein